MYRHQGCANTGTISIQRAGAKVRIHISKIIPQKYFPVFALMRIPAPHVFAQKLIPQEFFPACIGFVPGGNFSWSKIQKYIAEADADLIPAPGQIELHGRCRCGVLLSPCFGALCVADLILG